MKESFEEVLKRYERVIYWFAGKYRIVGFDYDDLVNIGRYVCWTCYQKYDESKGLQFSTFLVNRLKYEYSHCYRYSSRKKREGMKYLIGLETKCSDKASESFTYEDVVVSPEDWGFELNSAIQTLHEVIDKVPNKETKELLKQVIHYKVNVDETLTLTDIAGLIGIDRYQLYNKMRWFKNFYHKEGEQ